MKRQDQYEDSAKMEFWSLIALIVFVVIMLFLNAQ